MKRSKLYRGRAENVDRERQYPLTEAFSLLKTMPTAKFDETVELTCRLGIDPRHSDQVVRSALVLPRGSGKSVRVAVVAAGDAAQAAQDAGADEVGFEELVERIKGGWMEFDVLIATPQAMQKVRALGRTLGPRGLMPNPKTGTVTEDTASAVAQAKAGRVEYRSDRGGVVHVPIGKLSFDPEALTENAVAVLAAIQRARPATVKGTYFLGATVCSTMGPGLRVDVRDVMRA